MSHVFSRRVFFSAAAFVLAWLPVPSGLAQTVHVLPYVQPGDGRTLAGADVKVIRWLTDQTPGDFSVEFQPAGRCADCRADENRSRISGHQGREKAPEPKKTDPEPKKADPDDDDPKDKKEPKVPLPPEKDQRYFRYTAYLNDLPFNTDVQYRVKLAGKVIREATFKTRATADKSVRCVLVGDLAQGRPQQRESRIRSAGTSRSSLSPWATSSIRRGGSTSTRRYFWGTYNNVAEAGLKTGAPLMASVPFYPVLGNHDVTAKLSNTPDALAAYLFFSPPKGGPGEDPGPRRSTPTNPALARFAAATEDSYPNLDAYSFDYGAGSFCGPERQSRHEDRRRQFLKWLIDRLENIQGEVEIRLLPYPRLSKFQAALHRAADSPAEPDLRGMRRRYDFCRPCAQLPAQRAVEIRASSERSDKRKD